MSNIIDFVKFRTDKHLDPQVRYDSMIREILSDIRITTAECTLTSTKNIVTMIWKGAGTLTITLEPSNGLMLVDAHTDDGSISLKNVTCGVADNNRWIGYLFDDNF